MTVKAQISLQFFYLRKCIAVDLLHTFNYNHNMNRNIKPIEHKWEQAQQDSNIVLGLKNDLKELYDIDISEITSMLLLNRNITDTGDAHDFLTPDLSQLHDPYLMADMDKAVQIMSEAIVSEKKIWVFGDYDVDGVTAVSIITLFLASIGADVKYYIPERVSEGYGLRVESIRYIKEQGADVIITVDCGISNVDEVAFAKSLGIEVIITDHHEVPEVVPDAGAIVNPKRKDCPFPSKNIAGVGIAYNFLIALRRELRERGLFEDELPNLKRYLDLVALGTIADIVPLTGENRLFVKYGLDELKKDYRQGIVALRNVTDVKTNNISVGAVSFRLAPRLNASGRVGNAKESVRLLTTDDAAQAKTIALEIEKENKQRQSLEAEALKDAIEIVERDGIINRRSIVLASDNWHSGIVGIVASRLVDRYYRPTIMISLMNDMDGIGKGSARSISGFHIYNGISKLEALLVEFGGHKYAAGLVIEADKIEEFSERFEEVVTEMTTEDHFIPTLKIDAEITLSDIKRYNLLHEINLLSPFGSTNPEPVFLARGLVINEMRLVGKNHLKLAFKDNNHRWNAIAFGKGEMATLGMDVVDVVFNLRENKWEGGNSTELNIKDLKAV